MTDINAEVWVSSSHQPMGFPEFVVMIASIMALNPLAMDMMLPALPNIALAFHITIANRPQAVLSTFLIGFGVGQFVMGPLSDRFGRRPVLIDGMALYCIASVLAIMASSFETLLLARVLQGLGTSATRVIATSIVRDCYAGRRMASVMSLAMMVFIAVPVIAPSLGQAVLLLTQWRGIFIVLMLYGALALIWSALRMPETLPMSERKSLAIRNVLGAFRQTVTNRQTLGYALVIAGGKMGWVLEADLKNFFGSLNHDWVLRFVAHRVGDPRLISLIRRWLKAGILEDGKVHPNEEGTPQGGSISVLLSNLYLHHVLDLWFERVVKSRLRGEARLVRYIDDFVICFQYRSDAIRVQDALRLRLGKFGLTLEPTKTKLVEFGRFAQRHASKRGRKRPETIYFLGLTLYCTRNLKGNFKVGMRTEKSRLRRSRLSL